MINSEENKKSTILNPNLMPFQTISQGPWMGHRLIRVKERKWMVTNSNHNNTIQDGKQLEIPTDHLYTN